MGPVMSDETMQAYAEIPVYTVSPDCRSCGVAIDGDPALFVLQPRDALYETICAMCAAVIFGQALESIRGATETQI